MPLPFVFPYATAFWIAYVWAFYLSEWSMIRGSKAELPSATAPRQDSLRWLMSVALVAQVGAFGLAFWTPAQFPEREPMFWLGVALLLGGSMLRRHCFRVLGRNFTIDVRVSAAQSIVDRGAYAYGRHPGYTAAIAMLIGVGLALGSYISLAVITLMALFVYIRRIEFEERALVEVIGASYLTYARGRKRLIPYVY